MRDFRNWIEERCADDLHAAREHRGETCLDCRADIVRLVDAPASPAPPVTAEDIAWLQGEVDAEADEKYVGSATRILAALQKSEGNGSESFKNVKESALREGQSSGDDESVRYKAAWDAGFREGQRGEGACICDVEARTVDARCPRHGVVPDEGWKWSAQPPQASSAGPTTGFAYTCTKCGASVVNSAHTCLPPQETK
jgi:hypothetical protein